MENRRQATGYQRQVYIWKMIVMLRKKRKGRNFMSVPLEHWMRAMEANLWISRFQQEVR